MNSKILTLISVVFFHLSASAEDVRILISSLSEKKMDYLLTEKKFIELKSTPENFSKITWKLPDLLKNIVSHMNQVQVPKIVPSMKWQADKDAYPRPAGDSRNLIFRTIELCSHGKFIYWKIKMGVVSPIGTGTPYIVNVACYLNGEIAEIVAHDPKTSIIDDEI